jgi:ubiquinone biosynthesis protein UbiJ
MDWTAIIIAVVGGLLGGSALSAVINGCFLRKKTQAEADAVNLSTQVAAFIALVDRLEGRIERLHCRVEKMEADIEGRDMVIAKLTEENRTLHDELTQLKEQNDHLVKTNKELSARVKTLEEKLTKLQQDEC